MFSSVPATATAPAGECSRRSTAVAATELKGFKAPAIASASTGENALPPPLSVPGPDIPSRNRPPMHPRIPVGKSLFLGAGLPATVGPAPNAATPASEEVGVSRAFRTNPAEHDGFIATARAPGIRLAANLAGPRWSVARSRKGGRARGSICR